MTGKRTPTAPKGLSVAGKALWRDVHAGLSAAFELDERETALLAMAGRQADDVAELEAILKRDGLSVTGSTGQPRLHPAVAELRQGRLALARLLGGLELPNAEEVPTSAASQRGRKAAEARWEQRRASRERAHGAA